MISDLTQLTDPQLLSFYRQGEQSTKGLSLYAEGHIVVSGKLDGNPGSLASKPILFTATLNNLPGCFHSFHFHSSPPFMPHAMGNTTQSADIIII